MHVSSYRDPAWRRLHIKLRATLVACLAITGFFGMQARADESKIPAPFRGESVASPITINYDDWNAILHATVMESGRSDRSSAPPPRARLGTRMVMGSSSSLRNEGNRLLFAAFGNSKENMATIDKIRTELEAIPSQVPMKDWTKNEQLAYWLNLYNITVIEEIAKDYPVKSLKKLKEGHHSLWAKKVLKVAGVPLSLNDIHDILVNKWDTTLVMYGMFQGYIGGPSIMRDAFTGQNVHSLLIRNAKEFVNSNRGMKSDGRTLTISDYYEENKALFPNWNKDLKDHFMHLADPGYRHLVESARKIRAKTKDFYIADVGGGMKSVNQADNTNTAALGDTYVRANEGAPGSMDMGISSFTMEGYTSFNTLSLNELRLPPAAVEFMRHKEKKAKMLEGDVEVEEVIDKKADTKNKKQPK